MLSILGQATNCRTGMIQCGVATTTSSCTIIESMVQPPRQQQPLKLPHQRP